MVKEITTIIFNSIDSNKFTNNTNTNYFFNIDIPPIEIKKSGILKVSNFCHIGTALNYTDNMYLFRIRGVNVDNSKYFIGSGGFPLILSTTFNNNRSLYDENIITLSKQVINNLDIVVDTITPDGNLNNVLIINGGSNYLVGQVLSFGNNSLFLINSVNSGAITSISILNNGSGFSSSSTLPTLSTSINGSGAILVPVITTNSITSITISNAGAGYKTGQTLTISGGGGSGANISIASVDALGAILTFTITSGGSGYTSTPIISINSTTITQSASLTPLMNYGTLNNGIAGSLNFSITLTIEQDEF